MITISNISFFRFCWKNRKLDWPKCSRTVDECCCSNSAERNSNPVEAQPEGTLGSAVTIHQPH